MTEKIIDAYDELTPAEFLAKHPSIDEHIRAHFGIGNTADYIQEEFFYPMSAIMYVKGQMDNE